jgi:hypothetical protein
VAAIGGTSNAMGYDCMVTALANMIKNRVWRHPRVFSFSMCPLQYETPPPFESEQ